ncbi:hypothetical protein SAMN05216600_10413 [Pseudomonas cuatrocienegasensis]|uniref:Sel1 repeat-containing protein n=1 Tax=Pseudomonas cuatrocienegasensis TaxID=543360 RepID=A0ABY1B7W7_9PSED|nr:MULTISPECIES: tetratricopeptide repeat protein [Pseudomonas]OEC33862.1 hypothetical protein A7D25_16510 [Pseudomonas sp. 21C1]SEQ18454.1 hypothetical protein SAMN05216600_10413 [Pseudomonas cuatrocienegasensis]
MTPTLRTRASLSSLLVAMLVLGGCASQDTAPSGDAEPPAQTQQQPPADALSTLRSQANRGDVDSQFQLGSAYFIGNTPAAQAPPGTPPPPQDNPTRDLKQAEYWWKQAADRGHAMAAVSLAYLYTGRDNPDFANQQDMLKYLNQSAAGGNPMAQHILGNLYLRGAQGVPQDTAQARRLFDSACKAPYPASCEVLERLP